MDKPPYYKTAKLRIRVQAAITVLMLFLGYRLYGFLMHYESRGALPYVEHPEGVEGFLPIGALTSLKYFLLNLHVHPAHPAALMLFVGAIAVSVVLKKGFCGWICPVGFLEERLYKPFNRVFGRNPTLPKWIDYPLRSVKYILLFYFIQEILIRMPPEYVDKFLDSDYWKVSDLKMLYFFTDIGGISLSIIILLILLSLVFRNFWCRYLCPYGAFLGICSLVSPFEITRDTSKCIDCGKCTKNCPYHLPVDTKPKISSPECMSCMTCLSGCPTGAIEYANYEKTWKLSGRQYAAILLGIFFGIVLLAKVAGYWDSGVTDAEYVRIMPTAESIQHP